MYKIFLGILTVLISISLVVTDAQAKRFGGAKNIGVKHETSSFSRPNAHNSTAAPASRVAPAAAKPASGASKWLGPLAGLAIGGLLASLFMSNGIASGIMSWLVVALVAFLVWRLLRFFFARRLAPQATQFQAEPTANTFTTPFSPQANPVASGQGRIIEGTPVIDERIKDFDETTFLRQAKKVFIRLQAAYDTKNLNDIREFTAPEVFAEIQLQLQERGTAENFTEVVAIEADLVNLTTDQNGIIASVIFSGLIREQQGAAPVEVKEIWNFYNDDVTQNWLLVGIQQDPQVQ